MTFKAGQSGNPKGRPPLAPEMRDALFIKAAELMASLPNPHLTAHGLLSAIYKDDGQPLGLRLRAAECCLPYERAKPTAGSDGQDERLADRLKAAIRRVHGPDAADVIALAHAEQDSDEDAADTLSAPFTFESVPEADGAPTIIEGRAETITITAPTSTNVEDYI